MEKKWRVIIDSPSPGDVNMARDESLFLLYPKKKTPTLRLYGWQMPCVSLGYFQKVSEVLCVEEMRKDNIPFIRRITGGAAILHHKEITYSLILSSEDAKLSGSVKDSYKQLTSFLLVFYKTLGLDARYASSLVSGRLGRYAMFCFSSCEHFDVVIGSKKIGGNAQKRKRDLIFQHGSIPLSINFELIKRILKGIPPDIEEKTQGLNAFLSAKHKSEELIKKIVCAFQSTFRAEIEYGAFSCDEDRCMKELVKDKYSSKKWNARYEETFVA